MHVSWDTFQVAGVRARGRTGRLGSFGSSSEGLKQRGDMMALARLQPGLEPLLRKTEVQGP